MNSSYTQVVCLFLFLSGINKTFANSLTPLFFDCSIDTLSLCVEDEGVRLPANNKSFLGEGHPDATSCSVHVSQSIKVQPSCQGVMQYEVQLFLFDAGDPIVLQSVTTAATDSLLEAELSFDSELSQDTSVSQNGIPYTTKCDQYHRIKWIVTDSCGQVSVCEKIISIYDCSAPALEISQATAVIHAVSGTIPIYLEDFVLSFSDDCSIEEEVLLSLSPDFYQPDSSYYICDFDNWNVDFPHPLWIADQGRDINCNGMIEWSERSIDSHHITLFIVDPGFIDCFNEQYLIYGDILTPGGGGVPDVVVHFEGMQLNYPPALTDQGGRYHLAVTEQEFMLTITPEKNTSHKQGVSTLDLVRIQKHLLGAEEFASPYQNIAADANNSQHVSAIDLVELRKLILGIYTELPNNTSWRFIREDYDFDDVTNPWPHPGSITITHDSANSNFNFVGVKIGDVNNTAAPFTSGNDIEIRNVKPEILWVADQQLYQKGDAIEIRIRANSSIDLQGFQLTIASPDLLFTDVTPASLELDESTYSNFGDRMTMSWFDEKGVDLSKDDIVFTLKAIATQNGNLKTGLSINSEITEAEVYSMRDEIFTPQLLIHEDKELNSPTLMPNPWKDQTTIAIHLAQDGNTEIEILDLNGRLFYSESKYLIKGNNEIVLESKNFKARGLLMYSIKTEQESLSGKMVVLE